MLRRTILAGCVLGAGLAGAASAMAQDVSPTLLLESGPSDQLGDQAGYARMVRVHYLAGERVSASYKAYNRSEFIQDPDSAPPEAVLACARGEATTLAALRAFRDANRTGARPELARFCIKGVSGWEAGAKKMWLDPVFDGMPYAASLR